MLKTFTKWLKLKFHIHQYDKRPFFNEREVWWTQFGQNVGDEENGKGEQFLRPVIILRKFNKNICLVAPTSTKLKDNKYYYHIQYQGKKCSVLISQIRVIDAKRFRKRIARLSKHDLESIKKEISKVILGII
jgi:mRNA-degrading endonuclease toxin of MazEF toxin-antitoxin module